MSDLISLSRIHYPVTTLGPGKRIGIWFQGCSIQCKGCVSLDTWPKNIDQVQLEMIFQQIEKWLPFADGVTISGGEPFDQEDALLKILQWIKSKKNISILVYSGYSFDGLTQPLKNMQSLIDVLISEPYEWQQSQTKALRGSDNQQMHLLTKLGKQEFSIYEQATTSKKLDSIYHDGELWMTGVIEQNALDELKKHLSLQGHQIIHSKSKAKVKRES
ncbi:4Fe-4S single cluster domain-containing protein [Aliikangiella sp. IMCC44359]|uniref:4Fe-4S single cluster domain-containing protein n=1 Tax=Aliikangiella sp. IMCC44359 TaxID=3459125 RepID=UPI00403B0B46